MVKFQFFFLSFSKPFSNRMFNVQFGLQMSCDMLECITFHLTIEQNKLFSKLSIFQIVIDILQIRIDGVHFVISIEMIPNHKISLSIDKTKLTNCHHNIIIPKNNAAQTTTQWLQHKFNGTHHIWNNNLLVIYTFVANGRRFARYPFFFICQVHRHFYSFVEDIYCEYFSSDLL